MDSSDIIFPTNGSHLLSESPMTFSSSMSGSRTDLHDMSISELSLADRTITTEKAFDSSTVAQRLFSTADERDNSVESELLENDGQAEHKRRHAGKLREDKLQSDLFILRKLNTAFSNFQEALLSLGSINERIATQLGHTDALLNKYTGILERSDRFAQLIFDEEWQGADADYELLERQRLEKEKREAQELALALKQEKEEQLQAEQERIQKENERIEQERKQNVAVRSGARGVRGTRASMRGTRGFSRTAPIGISTNSHSGAGSTARTSSSNTSKLPMPSSANRSNSTRSSMRATR